MNPARIAVLVVLCAASTAFAQKEGDRTFGKFADAEFWYPATIIEAQEDHIALRYDDGQIEATDKSQLRPLVWSKNQRVECEFKGDWLGGKVTDVSSGTLTVALKNGSSKKSPMAKCRTDDPPQGGPEAARKAAPSRESSGEGRKQVDETEVDSDGDGETTDDD